MTVRTATAADIEALVAVAERSWRADYADILTRETAEAAVTDWYEPERLEAELTFERTLLLVAEREGVVGFSHATWGEYTEEGEGYVLRLYVDPDHRRAGVGRELLEGTVDALAERGVERVNAMVLAANEPGRAFYERFGFEDRDGSQTEIGGRCYEERRYVRPVERDGGEKA